MPLNRRIDDWRGQRVWLVGASSGIGAAIGQQLAWRGARIAASARSGPKLRAVFAHVADALIIPADVTNVPALQSAMDTIVGHWGGVDCVMVLAGNYFPLRAWELSPNRAQDLVSINLTGAIDTVAVALPHLLAQERGAVVIVSSVAGYRGLPNGLLYGATKAALINFAEALYLDLAPRGIGVYLVNPGFVETPLTAQNTFRMPALISAQTAATETLAGIARGEFEIHFPKRFTRWLKLLRVLPYRWYFAAIRRFVKG